MNRFRVVKKEELEFTQRPCPEFAPPGFEKFFAQVMPEEYEDIMASERREDEDDGRRNFN